MTEETLHLPTIERALEIERYLLAHRDQILKIEHLLTMAAHTELASTLRYLLIAQCVTKVDLAELLLAAERAKGIKNRKASEIQFQRFKDDFKAIRKRRAEDPQATGFSH